MYAEFTVGIATPSAASRMARAMPPAAIAAMAGPTARRIGLRRDAAMQRGATHGSVRRVWKVCLHVNVERDGMLARNLTGKFGIERREENPGRRKPPILWVARSPLIERILR